MNVYTLGNLTGGFVTYITITAGETVALAIDLSTCDTPINLTGYSLKCRIEFGTPLDLITGNSGITLTDALNGKIQLNIGSTTSASFTPGSYPFDVWMVNGSVETPLLAGTFTVVANVSPVP